MDPVSLASAAVSASAGQTQSALALSVTKASFKADQAVADLVRQSVDSARAAPAPGTGQRLDKTA